MKKSLPKSPPTRKNPPKFAQKHQTEKAYKLLSIQRNISHHLAKSLIDRGLVSIKGKRVPIARAMYNKSSRFEVQSIQKPRVIFEDSHILAIEKPEFIESYELCKFFPHWCLLHRLDRETSGVILLVKENSEFHLSAKRAFAKELVYKEYYCVVSGIIADSMEINAPILTKKGKFAKSRIDKSGKSAKTLITPLELRGKNTLLKAIITTGRTHQIRVHLQHIAHPILGDNLYGKLDSAKRLMLHAHKIKLFNYEFTSPLPF